MVQFVEDRSCETQYQLGDMFHHGDDRSRDYEQAVKWYTHAARKGYRRAQHRLGTMYAKGLGVSRNFIKAYAWCKVSADQQSKFALRKLKKIEARLKPAEIAEANRLARQYYDVYVVPFK